MIIYQQTNNGVVEKIWKQGDKPIYSKENGNEREVWDVVEIRLDYINDKDIIDFYRLTSDIPMYSYSNNNTVRIFGDMAKFIAANL